MRPRKVMEFISDRIKHMNSRMTERGFDLPDPADLLPSDWRNLSKEHKHALYCEAWAICGANIATQEWKSRQLDWVQDPLPLAEFYVEVYSCASGWCAPSDELTYDIVDASAN